MRSRSSKKCSWVSAISSLSNDASNLCSSSRDLGAAADVPGRQYRKGRCFKNARREELITSAQRRDLASGLLAALSCVEEGIDLERLRGWNGRVPGLEAV